MMIKLIILNIFLNKLHSNLYLKVFRLNHIRYHLINYYLLYMEFILYTDTIYIYQIMSI